jgi:hypothetical protein
MGPGGLFMASFSSTLFCSRRSNRVSMRVTISTLSADARSSRSLQKAQYDKKTNNPGTGLLAEPYCKCQAAGKQVSLFLLMGDLEILVLRPNSNCLLDFCVIWNFFRFSSLNF